MKTRTWTNGNARKENSLGLGHLEMVRAKESGRQASEPSADWAERVRRGIFPSSSRSARSTRPSLGIVTCDGLASYPGGVTILLVASCYEAMNNLFCRGYFPDLTAMSIVVQVLKY